MAPGDGHRSVVTGAGGFIGSHLCEALVQSGVRVRALCRYTSRRDEGNLALIPPDVRSEIEVEFGDMRDRDFVGRIINGADVVYNLAASISVPYSFVAPREVVMTNIEGTLNVLTASADAEIPRVVQVSSSEVYGTAQYTPMDEHHPLDAQSPYAASKVGADKLAESFHRSYGLPVVVARPFNTYGPRQSLRAVIPTVVAQALAGGELELGAVSPTRDFVFVRDTVEGLIRLGQDDVPLGEVFNIATGEDVSVARIVEIVSQLLGRELSVRSVPERMRPNQSEVHQLRGDARKLMGATQWKPQTGLREGLHAVLDWITERGLAAKSDAYAV